MLSVVATLQQRCGNVLITSETDVGTTLIFDSATMLWQRQQRRCDVATTSLCQLGHYLRFLIQLHKKGQFHVYWRNQLSVIFQFRLMY